MAMKIRLSRGGAKKRPFYHVVAADSRMPRDGRFIEKLGTYNPLLPKDSEERVKLKMDRIQHWLDQGAQPSDRVSRFLESAGVVGKKERNNPNKAEPGKKAQERAQEKADKVAAAADADAAATADEAVSDEVAVADTTAADEAVAAEDTAATADTAADEGVADEGENKDADAQVADAADSAEDAVKDTSA